MIGGKFGGLVASTALATALACCATASRASGADGYGENIYVPENHVPAQELQAYARDNLRVVAPGYWRIYQFIAYRAMTGHPLSKEEVDVLHVDGWKVGPHNDGVNDSYDIEKTGVKEWLQARNAFTGSGPANERFDVVTNAGDYAMFINCNRDAFLRAAKTLAQRNAQYGKQWTTTWLAGQNAVFANCSPQLPQATVGKALARPLTMPPALPASAPEWLAKDLAYQNASALFYAGRYDEARARYMDIAKDGGSPWQPLGQYLAARCLIRKASLMTVPDGTPANTHSEAYKTLLMQARAELQAISSRYAPAKALIGWVEVRLRPDERRQELSARLAMEKITADNLQDVTDYLVLMDDLENQGMLDARDDMSAWIGAMQCGSVAVKSPKLGDDASGHAAALQLARNNWNKKHEMHWLAAVLQVAWPLELNAEEVKAASAVEEDSPVYGTAQYSLARLNFAHGKMGAVEAGATAMLAKPLTPSVRNRWLRVKMASAGSAEAFFAAAPRVAVDDTSEAPPTNEGKVSKPEIKVDDDFSRHLTRDFSLEALSSYRAQMPASEKSWIAEMAWSRAVLLGDYAAADGWTDELIKGRDTTKHLYERFKAAKSSAEKKDAAMLILANTPELGPYVTDLSRDNSYGSVRYWSCYGEAPSADDLGDQVPPFLTPDERSAVAAELGTLRKLPRRSTYLVPQIIEWAKRNKTDPEAPKALHFLVAATRNECSAAGDRPQDGNAENRTPEHNYSRDAYQFLHAQFPKSEWTLKTKYYY
jgi:hypothetical protein